VWVSERNTLQHTATYLSTSTTGHGDDICEDTATHYTSLQYTAAHCNIFEHLHNGPQRRHLRGYCNILHYTTTHCNTLQHTATFLSNFTASHSDDICEDTATHYTTLQQTATHCNIFEHLHHGPQRRHLRGTPCAYEPRKFRMLQCVAVRSVLQLQDAMCYCCSMQCVTIAVCNVAVCYSVLRCVAVCCSVLQCVAVCNVSQLQYVTLQYAVCHTQNMHILTTLLQCCSVLHCVALCCIVLQCVAVCCSTYCVTIAVCSVLHPPYMNHTFRMLQCVAVRSVLQLQDVVGYMGWLR